MTAAEGGENREALPILRCRLVTDEFKTLRRAADTRKAGNSRNG